MLAAVLALALLPSGLVAGALPIFRLEWQASAGEMGWVVAAYQAGYVMGVLVLLPLTDAVGAARVMTLSVLGTSLAAMLFPLLAREVWTAAALRLLAGVGLAGVYMPGVRLVAATSHGRRGLAVGAYVSAFYLGEAASLWSTGSLLPPLGWRGAAAALGVISTLAVPLALLASRGVSEERGRAIWLPLHVLRHPDVRRFVLAYTGHAWELYGSRAWLPAFLASVLAGAGPGSVASTAQSGRWAGLIVGMGAVGVWAGGWLSDRFGRARTAFAIATTTGCLSLVFGQLAAAGWALLALTACVYGVLLAADSGIYSASVAERAPRELVGSAQAAQASLGFLGATLAPIVAGFAVDAGGGYQATFVVAGIGGLLAAVALYPAARRAADR